MNRGAELLKATGLSLSEIAEKCGLRSRTLPHRWTKGQELPNALHLATLESLGVPSAAWSEPAGAPTTLALVPPPPAHDAPLERRTVLEMAEDQVDRLRRLQREAMAERASVQVRLGVERELRAALAHLAEVRGLLTADDESRILRSEAWVRIKGALVGAIATLPAAGLSRAQVAGALQGALEELDATRERRAAA